MTQGNEILATQEWIYSTLNGDTEINAAVQGRIYDGLAPVEASPPWLILQDLSHVDVDTVGNVGSRVITNSVWLVVAVTTGPSIMPIVPLAARIDALLHNARNVAVPDGTVYGCRRTGPFRRVEESGGIQYRRLGGIYRIYVQ